MSPALAPALYFPSSDNFWAVAHNSAVKRTVLMMLTRIPVSPSNMFGFFSTGLSSSFIYRILHFCPRSMVLDSALTCVIWIMEEVSAKTETEIRPLCISTMAAKDQ